MYSFTSCIDLNSLAPFQDLIPKNILQKIESSENQLIAFGAYTPDQKPAGICIALIDPLLRCLDFLQLKVAEPYPLEEIGKALLDRMHQERQKHDLLFSSFIYEKNAPESISLEKVLKSSGWNGPRPFLIRAKFDPTTFDCPLIHLPLNYPAGYKQILWKNLSKQHRENLLYRNKQGEFSKALSPFQDEELIELANSLALEHDGRIIGWMITHRLDPETIRYTALYVEPRYKFKSPAMKLLAESMLLHKQNPTKWALIEIPFLQVRHSWVDFIQKRILPSAIETNYLVQAWI